MGVGVAHATPVPKNKFCYIMFVYILYRFLTKGVKQHLPEHETILSSRLSGKIHDPFTLAGVSTRKPK